MYSTSPLFQKSATPNVHCADMHHSANVWVKARVRVKVRVSLRVRLRVSGNSKLSEQRTFGIADPNPIYKRV